MTGQPKNDARPMGFAKVDPDWIPDYPCHSCHKPFKRRSMLAHHDCYPRGKPIKTPYEANKRRFTDGQVLEIRAEYAKGGTTISKLAARYGVGESVVQKLLARRTYKDI